MLMGAQVLSPPGASLSIAIRGILPTDAAEVVRDHLAPIVGAWAGQSRVRLTRLSEPRLARGVVAQIDVRMAGQRIRAQVAAVTTAEVVTALARRTIEQLQPYPAALAQCLRGHPMTSLPPSPPELLPPDARRLARQKICLPTALTVAEAIAVLEAMDYRFHLFREKYSRQDSFVVRAGSGNYRVIQPTPNPMGLDLSAPQVGLVPARRLNLDQARACLDLTGGPFQVFTDRATGRACALYTRYDGHYGLLTPTAVRSVRGTS